MTALVKNILKTIGNTPLFEFDGILIKCEYANPSGSIKARMMTYIVERAEQEGLIRPGDTLVEATSGNTGNALAFVAAAKGYKALVLMPRGYSAERAAISRAYGAEVKFVGHFSLEEAVKEAKRLGEQEGYYCPMQFENPWNTEANFLWLGQEIVDEIPDGVTIDAVVQGVGTGGTLIGVGRALREKHNADVKLFAVQPQECKTLDKGEVKKHMIEGIADGFVPAIFQRNRSSVTDIISIKGVDAVDMMKKLAKDYGILVGVSSGANFLAAKMIRDKYPEISNVLTFFCDAGEKYLLQYYGGQR